MYKWEEERDYVAKQTDKWRDGYGAYNHDKDFDENESEEWKAGFLYAFHTDESGLKPM